MSWIPEGLERATYVHMANMALFILILLWQPIPADVWNVEDSAARDLLWFLFAAGWGILFLGAWPFGPAGAAGPRAGSGHLLLALALTAYVLIAMRFEERDLLHRFGPRYADWRGVP